MARGGDIAVISVHPEGVRHGDNQTSIHHRSTRRVKDSATFTLTSRLPSVEEEREETSRRGNGAPVSNMTAVASANSPPEAENWDDDFVFHSVGDEPRSVDSAIRASVASQRNSVVWEEFEDSPQRKAPTRVARPALPDEVMWGDSDDDVPPASTSRTTPAERSHASPDPSPSKWTTDGEDDVASNSGLYDMDRTVTLKQPPSFPNLARAATSAMSSSASLQSLSHDHVHLPPVHDRSSPIPYSPASPTLSSAFSTLGTSSTAHLALRNTASKASSSFPSASITYQPPPRPRRRLRKKSRPPHADDIFELQDTQGFPEELEAAGYSSSNTGADPSARQTSSRPSTQSSARPRQRPSIDQTQDFPPKITDPFIQSQPGGGTSALSAPSSPSSKAALLSRIGSMKNWPKRRGRQSSLSNIDAGSLLDNVAPSAEPRGLELTYEPEDRAANGVPSTTVFSSVPDDQDTTQQGTTGLGRQGSLSQRSVGSNKKRTGIGKVFGLISTSASQSSLSDAPRRPMSLMQAPSSRPLPGRQAATMGRSTSNPYFQALSQANFDPPSNYITSLGPKNLQGMTVHKRTKSTGGDSVFSPGSPGRLLSPLRISGEEPTHVTRPATPPVKISDTPPLLPPIELSPPSPPRAAGAGSSSYEATGSFLNLAVLQSIGTSPVRSPAGTASLGRANGAAFMNAYASGSMRRNSLGDLKIPKRISRAQAGLKSNLTMVREFATTVEKLKGFQIEHMAIKRAIDAALADSPPTLSDRGINGHDYRPPTGVPQQRLNKGIGGLHASETLTRLENDYALWWECAELLIELGGGKQEDDDGEKEADQSFTSMPEINGNSLGVHNAPRERAITLESTSFSSAAAAAAKSSTKSPTPASPFPWKPSEGRNGLSPRQLALLKEMLTNPDPATLQLPDPPVQTPPPESFLNPFAAHMSLVVSALGQGSSAYMPYHPATSAVTLPDSSASSSARGVPSSTDLSVDQHIATPKSPGKLRRASRAGMTSLKEIIRTLRKTTSPQQPAPPKRAKSTPRESRAPSTNPPPVPPLPSMDGRPQNVPQSGVKTSTGAHTVAALEKTEQSAAAKPPSEPLPTRPFSSQANRKSPRRPSLASLFGLGKNHKGDRKRSDRSATTTATQESSVPGTTTEEDLSDWDRIDTASDLDHPPRAFSPTGTNVEHDKLVNQATVKGRKRRDSSLASEDVNPAPPLPKYQTLPNASESSLSLRGSPRAKPARLKKPIPVEATTPKRPTVSRPPSRGRMSRQSTNSSLPSIPFGSLLANRVLGSELETIPSAVDPSPTPTIPESPGQPSVPTSANLVPSTDARPALTPENIRPLLECAKEVAARLSDCVGELRILSITLISIA